MPNELMLPNSMSSVPFVNNSNPIIPGYNPIPLEGGTPLPPNSGSIDANAQLQQILAGLQQPQQQVSPLQRILTAIAQGVGTATSGNPGGALLQQIQQQQQMQQQQQERQDKLNMIVANFKLNNLNKQLDEEQQIRREQRGEGFQIRQEERTNKQRLAEFEREAGLKYDLQSMDDQTKLDLAELSNTAAMDRLTKELGQNKELETLRITNAKQAQINEQTIQLTRLGVDNAAVIADKLFNNPASLTKEDKANLSQAAKLSRMMQTSQINQNNASAAAARASMSRGSSDQAYLNKQYESGLKQAYNKVYLKKQDGSIIEEPKDSIQRLQLQSEGALPLSPLEKGQYINNVIAPSLAQGLGLNSVPKPTSDIAAPQANATLLDQTIKLGKDSKLTDDQIKAKIDAAPNFTPEEKQEAYVRNGLIKQSNNTDAKNPAALPDMSKDSKGLVKRLSETFKVGPQKRTMESIIKERPGKIIADLKERREATKKEIEYNKRLEGKGLSVLEARLKDIEDRLKYAESQVGK